MKSKKNSTGYIIRLEKGEEVMETLTKFCETEKIKSGSISGIGATSDATLKSFDVKTKKYLEKKFSGENYEILSLNGNITSLNDKPFLHMHAVLSDPNYIAFGGHLGSATISTTGEIIINTFNDAISRKLDNEFQLNFINI